MLQTNTVSPELLRVLKGLMQTTYFDKLLLVGGTSLALQIGHRESVGIDLFGQLDFEYEMFSDDLSKIGRITPLKRSKNINVLNIDNIKVDFVNYRYPWIASGFSIDGIRLASIKDIGAMKLNTIAGRGTKKDFVDLYFLLRRFSFSELFDFYTQKFDDGNAFLVQKSLTYFEDAENNEMPKMYEEVSWEEIKRDILGKFKAEGF